MLAACAAAFGLGARLKKHRRTGGDGGGQRYIDPKHGLLIEDVRDGRADVGYPRKGLNAAAPERRGCGGSAPSRGSTGRRATNGRTVLMARHVPHLAGHQGIGARACGGADPNSRRPALLQGEDVDVVTDERPSTEYVRQA
ncbi:hypothetical protein GCM10010211_46340 [Streptomyces albospinus]|uniref:Uncharacterized protein n=1 Tax=Streptomyces albospinus TaxID=285515 RepID=A0ABQ2VBQ0_9ACTN|nr:hypothetical protein GCM10010211_46340 [Streptomyces albospinus]